MSHYMATSVKIYETYLEFIAPEDIHVYSIDEVLSTSRLIWKPIKQLHIIWFVN